MHKQTGTPLAVDPSAAWATDAIAFEVATYKASIEAIRRWGLWTTGIEAPRAPYMPRPDLNTGR